MADNNAQELHRREEKLFAKKATLDTLRQELAYNFYPERADFTVERTWGEEFAAHLFDSAPVLNRRDLGNAFSSMLRPRGQPWFRAWFGDEELMERPHIGQFSDAITEAMRDAMYSRASGFVKATKLGDHDFATFGNAVLTVESKINRAGKRHLLYRDWHLRDCAWVFGDDGEPDTMFRKFKLAARLIVRREGWSNFSDAIKEAADKDPDKEFELCHVMMPAEDYDYQKKPSLKTPWASIYYDTANQGLLGERPSHSFRYVVPGWQPIDNSPYCLSPAAICNLSDARGLQIMARVTLEAGEKQVDPPYKVTGKAIRGEINLYAGGVTWVDKDYDERMGAALEPMMLGENTGLGLELLTSNKAQSKDAWYLTKLTLPPQAKTAYETAQLVEEFVRANIPLFEPMETTYNAALLEETATEMLRLGAFGPPQMMPPELRGMELEFKFANPLQDAIERNKVNQASTALGLAAVVAKIDPSAVRRINATEMLADAIRGSGAPADWLVDDETAAAQDRALQQQAATQGAVGDIVGALNTAGQAADVVDRGAAAAQRLRELSMQPAVDQQAVYGPT